MPQHAHPAYGSVPRPQHPTWSVPEEQGGPGYTDFQSLSSEITLELQAADNLTPERQSMGMNTVI